MDYKAFFEGLLSDVIHYGIRLLIALVIILVGFKIVNVVMKKVKKGKGFQKMDPTAASFMGSFLSILLKAILLVTAVAVMGIPMASIVAVLAAGGLAIGMALQGSLSNFAGGVMLMVFRPFRVGDYIETQAVQGSVREVTIFYTKLTTVDNREVTLPNGALMNASIINYTAHDLRRVDLVFHVAYASDIDRVKEVLASIAAAHPLALKDPEPMIVVAEQGTSSLDIAMRVWCKTENYWDLRFQLVETVKKAFDKVGIEIPFEQLDVHIKNPETK